MELKTILELMKNKYSDNTVNVVLLIFDDESGRITNDPENPYEDTPLFEFESIEELTTHLQEN